MDDYEGSQEAPLTLNKYTYGNANPVRNIDPTGNFSIFEAFGVLANLGTIGNVSSIIQQDTQETILRIQTGNLPKLLIHRAVYRDQEDGQLMLCGRFTVYVSVRLNAAHYSSNYDFKKLVEILPVDSTGSLKSKAVFDQIEGTVIKQDRKKDFIEVFVSLDFQVKNDIPSIGSGAINYILAVDDPSFGTSVLGKTGYHDTSYQTENLRRRAVKEPSITEAMIFYSSLKIIGPPLSIKNSRKGGPCDSQKGK